MHRAPQTPDVWEWTDEAAAYCLSYDPNPNPTSSLRLTQTPNPNPNPNPDHRWLSSIVGGIIINRKSGGDFSLISK